jgi:beta-lactamase superfamily II metal-dependent hydrolase
MMSYIIKTPKGKLIVIDGGLRGEADYLLSRLDGMGGAVELWLLSHLHIDHMDALAALIAANRLPETKAIAYRFLDEARSAEIEPDQAENNHFFFSVMAAYKGHTITLNKGQIFEIDGLKIEVLTACYPQKSYTSLNDTTSVFRFTFPNGASALFLGDLSDTEGHQFAAEYGAGLKSDIVQMARHGQGAVGFEVYEKINPSVCLWPSPEWLYECDSGGGKGSGPWATLETRAWMERLGVKTHLVIKDGEGVVV